MQNVERYFGYKVVLTDQLDPVRLAVLKEKAEYIMEMNSFTENEFVVYFHQLSLIPVEEHFSNSFNLEEKIKRLDLSFAVNPKQVRNGKIKLYNYLLKRSGDPSNFREISHAHAINYMIQGVALKEMHGFRNEIVTFVNKTLRKDHRKLKVSLSCRPTDHFKDYLTNQQDIHLTQIDYKLDSKSVRLLKGKRKNKELAKSVGVINVNNYTNNGVVGQMGQEVSAVSSTFNQQMNSGNNLSDFLDALNKLKNEMKVCISEGDEEQEESLSAITLALGQAKQGNETQAIEYIKKSGKWALGISEKIGTTILSAYIKSELGL
ncbi:hypothetical protein [Vibrio metschnikovii]|uniref:hypothetical protein n=1 Tax=Vibrio metschnikovii TaxID=28172 RepID=UPI002FC7469A|nr:hypothetical protein [Vibrio metschnikovii]